MNILKPVPTLLLSVVSSDPSTPASTPASTPTPTPPSTVPPAPVSSTVLARPPVRRRPRAARLTPEQLRDLEDLLFHASQGDAHAITALAIPFGRKLCSVSNRLRDKGVDVNDFLNALRDGELAHVPPMRGNPIGYVKRLMRVLSRKRRAELRAML